MRKYRRGMSPSPVTAQNIEESISDNNPQAEQACRICGCTWNNACLTDEGPCYWVEPDLCSACVKSLEMGMARDSLRSRMLIGGRHVSATRKAGG